MAAQPTIQPAPIVHFDIDVADKQYRIDIPKEAYHILANAISLAEKRAGHAEIEHIAIFDEAQRSWNHKKLADWLARGGSFGNKKKVPNLK